MDEFTHYFWLMIYYRRLRRENETMENYYQFYKNIVECEIGTFFNRFKFWKRWIKIDNELPF